MNEGKQRTPFQEAMSAICSASVLVGLGCYVAALNGVPFVSPFLYTVAAQVYHRLPVLNALRAPQAPMLVAALAIGTVSSSSLPRWLIGWRACSLGLTS